MGRWRREVGGERREVGGQTGKGGREGERRGEGEGRGRVWDCRIKRTSQWVWNRLEFLQESSSGQQSYRRLWAKSKTNLQAVTNFF